MNLTLRKFTFTAAQKLRELVKSKDYNTQFYKIHVSKQIKYKYKTGCTLYKQIQCKQGVNCNQII